MKNKLSLGVIFLIVYSSLVFASDNAPPSLPSEYWGTVTMDGNPAANGLAILAEVNGVDYTQENPVTFNNGYYNIMLVNGDRELTYLNDPTCATHWAAGEACVPCSTNPADEDYCIEGPQNGAIVKIKINGVGIMPNVDWFIGSSYEVNTIAPLGDWSKEGCVDMTDIGYFANHYLEICTPLIPEICDFYDIYKDNLIDMADVGVFANHYGEGCGG